MTKDSEHLQWLHDRFVEHFGVSENTDYLIRFRKIIREIGIQEQSFQDYLDFIAGKSQGVHQPDVDNTSTPPAKQGEEWANEYKGEDKDWKDEVLEKEPVYQDLDTGKLNTLFENLVPTWTIRYEDPTRGNKGEAVYYTISANTEDEAKTLALANPEFTQHILPEHFEKRYLTAFEASGNYVIGKVEYFEGDPRL